jgi:hypothetical protein
MPLFKNQILKQLEGLKQMVESGTLTEDEEFVILRGINNLVRETWMKSREPPLDIEMEIKQVWEDFTKRKK